MAFWNRFFLGESKTKLEVNPTNDFFTFLGNETKNLQNHALRRMTPEKTKSSNKKRSNQKFTDQDGWK